MKKLFLLVSTLLFFGYNYLDFNCGDSTYIKYLLIILCFLYSLKGKNKYIKLGLFITVIADYFLLVTSHNYNFGIFCFCVVQTIYMLMINKKNSFIYRIIIYLALVLILPLFYEDRSLETLLALYSILFLTINVFESFKVNKILFIGLGLFWLCDISVGLYNMGILRNITAYTMWLFYGPSQILLTIFGEKYEKK